MAGQLERHQGPPGAPGPAAGSERHPAGLSVGSRLHPSPTRPPERATAWHSEGQCWPVRHPAPQALHSIRAQHVPVANPA